MGKRVYSEDIGQLPIRGTIVECYLPPRESIVCNNCDKKSVTAFEITGRADVSNAFADLRVALCGECADELMDILGHRGKLYPKTDGELVTMGEHGDKPQDPANGSDKRRTEMSKNTECVVVTAHPLMSSKDLNDLGKMLSAGYTISANETVMVSEDLTLVILRKDDTQGTTGGAS